MTGSLQRRKSRYAFLPFHGRYITIFNTKNLLNRADLMKLYYAFIYSTIRYGIIFWGNSKGVERIFKMQKRILRNIFGLKKRETCRLIFEENEIMTVHNIYIRESVLFVNRNRHYFTFNREIENYRGRKESDVRIMEMPKGMIAKGLKFNYCSKIYNKLPRAIKAIEERNIFKSKVDELCKKSVYYT